MLVEYASYHVQHQKALPDEREVQHVIRDITGKTSDIMEAIVKGERRKLARLRDPRIKADEKTIAKSLRGHWREQRILTQALELSYAPSATVRSKPSWNR